MLLNLLGPNARIIGRARYYFWVRNHMLTLRLSLIALCLGLTIASALFFVDRGPFLGMMPIVFILVVAGFLFIYYNLELTLLVTLVVSTVFHVGIDTGTGTPITLTFVLLILAPMIWFFKMMVVDKSFKIRALPANWPALFFVITVIISTLWSGAFVDDEIRFLFMDKVNPRVMTALSLIVSVLTYFMIANHVRSIRAISFFVWWFIAFGSAVGVLKILGVNVFPPLNDDGQIATFVIILILGQTLFNQELPFKLRLLCVVFCVIVFYRGFVGITWLSGWVPSVVGISILLLFRSRKWLVLFLIVVSVVVVLRADTWRQVVEAENTESGVTRVAAWNRALRLVDDHLLFGTGPAGYYFYMLVYGGARQLSHNNFLDILSQTGIIGFICFVWLWLAIGWTTWRMYRSIPRPGFRYGLAGSLVAAYFVSIVCMMLGDWITPFPYTQTLRGIDYTIWHWMMAGLTVALYYERQHPATDPLKSSAMAPSSTLVAQSNP